MANLIGQHLGQYEIQAILGEGGMATVYRARQQSMKRDVAVKVIESKLARNPDFVKRFEREAQTVASLSHIHILRVFDYGDQDELIYLVMELLTGGSLADLLDRGPLPPDTASRMLDQIAAALDYAHRRGIIHRDLKPQNVLLDDTGDIRLSDFGIAKLLSETTALTQSGVAMGTPSYMSPEQGRGSSVDARSDLYSLGVMMFEMLSGQLPFNADTPLGMVYAHIHEAPPPIRSLRPDLPSAVEQVIAKVLAKDPAQRFSSAGELASTFRLALVGQTPVVAVASPFTVPPSTLVEMPMPLSTPGGSTAPILSAASNRKTPRLIGLIGLAAVILLIGGLALLMSRNNQSVTTPTVLAIAAQPTIPAAATKVTQIPTFMPTLTGTPSEQETRRVIVATTPTNTNADIPASVPTDTSTKEPTQISVQDSAATLIAEQWTQTANAVELYTKTPLPTGTPTLNRVQTVAAIAGVTETAYVVALYSETPTPTITFTTTSAATNTSTPNQTKTAAIIVQAETAYVIGSYTKTSTPTSTYTETYTPTSTITPNETQTTIAALTETALVVASYTKTLTPTKTFTPTSPATNVSRPINNGKIVFSRKYENIQIYVMNADGSSQRGLPNYSPNDQAPSWSPDSKKLVFLSYDNLFHIYVMNADGSGRRKLTNGSGGDYDPSWSPDGKQIAFSANRDGHYQIYVMNADGSSQRNLSKSDRGDYQPSWSPNGKQIAFTSDRDGRDQIYVMNANGDGQYNLSNSARPTKDGQPSWSPDGKQIAFTSDRDGQYYQIYVMNVDGSNQHNISNSIKDDLFPSWSSDSQQIVFQSNRDGRDQIYVMNADGSDQHNISNINSEDSHPSWQPAPR